MHPIWKDFKNIKINVDTALIFPHGTGGHFLTKCKNLDIYEGRLNEYHVREYYPWFKMDTWGMEYKNDIARLDDMYDVVDNLLKFTIQSDNPIIVGHYLPQQTLKIFDLTINEMIVITVKPEDAWLPLTLANIKNLFVSSYHQKHFLINHIMSNFHASCYQKSSNFNRLPYNNMISGDTILVANRATSKIRSDLIDSSSPYMWDYVVWAKSNGFKLNPETFIKFTDVIFGVDAVNEYYNSYYNIDDAIAFDTFKNYTSKFIEVDYIDLFFLGKIPANSSLEKLEVTDILNYSETNLKILEKFANINTSDRAIEIKNSVDRLREMIKDSQHG